MSPLTRFSSVPILGAVIPSSRQAGNVEMLAGQYNSVRSVVVDRHAPERTQSVIVKEIPPWFSDDVITTKRKFRKSERCWRRIGPCVDRQIFTERRNMLRETIEFPKSIYFRTEIE